MPCHAMHPIQDLFLESFSYVLQIDMHFICAPMLMKLYSCKKWVLHGICFKAIKKTRREVPDPRLRITSSGTCFKNMEALHHW
jgi:hypothetical protein